MDSNGALEKILRSFERYYTVSTENIAPPFAAEAVFKSHSEQYFLVKAAKVADIDSNEFVFFYCNKILNQSDRNNASGRVQNDNQTEAISAFLSAQKVTELSETAWERGLSRVAPYFGHRNSDITLIIFSDSIADGAFSQVKKTQFYKSYKFGFYGWSSFRLLAYEVSTGRAVTNRRGSDLKKLVAKL